MAEQKDPVGGKELALDFPYNPLDPEQLKDPYPLFARAREEAPVFFVPAFNLWVVTRYEDIWSVIKDTDRFSSRASTGVESQPDPEVVAILKEGYGEVSTLVTEDPPQHSRFRGLVNKAFTPRRVASRETRIREIVNGLIDRFLEKDKVDLVWELAYPLPMTVIAEILGVGSEDLDRFKKWSDNLVARLSVGLTRERELECARSLVEFQHYFNAKFDEREKDPQDDMLTALLQARIEGEKPLTRPEALSMLQQILVAGNETTTNLIANMLFLLLSKRERWEEVCANPDLVPNVVEEALRMEAPVQGLFRVAKVDVELGGVQVPAGAQLQMLYAAGSRDPREFENGEEFDMHRKNAVHHLAFGGGAHFCLGAALARLEGKILLEILSSRVPSLRLDLGEQAHRVPHFFLRGFEHLWAEWGTDS